MDEAGCEIFYEALLSVCRQLAQAIVLFLTLIAIELEDLRDGGQTQPVHATARGLGTVQTVVVDCLEREEKGVTGEELEPADVPGEGQTHLAVGDLMPEIDDFLYVLEGIAADVERDRGPVLHSVHSVDEADAVEAQVVGGQSSHPHLQTTIEVLVELGLDDFDRGRQVGLGQEAVDRF